MPLAATVNACEPPPWQMVAPTGWVVIVTMSLVPLVVGQIHASLRTSASGTRADSEVVQT